MTDYFTVTLQTVLLFSIENYPYQYKGNNFNYITQPYMTVSVQFESVQKVQIVSRRGWSIQ